MNTVLPYLNRVKADLAREFSYIVWISERVREEGGPTTYGNLRDKIRDILTRTQDLQAAVKKQAEGAEAQIGRGQ